MGIVQVKIKKESPIGSSISLTGERKKSPFRLEWWTQSTGMPVFLLWKQINIWSLIKKKNHLPKVIYSMENVKHFSNFQSRIDFQLQNPKPITPTIFN